MEIYKNHIFWVLRRVRPGNGVWSKAKPVMNYFINDVFQRLVGAPVKLDPRQGAGPALSVPSLGHDTSSVTHVASPGRVPLTRSHGSEDEASLPRRHVESISRRASAKPADGTEAMGRDATVIKIAA